LSEIAEAWASLIRGRPVGRSRDGS
jgi:hypothetical protein